MTDAGASALLTVEDVTLQYGAAGRSVTAIERVSFAVQAAERFVILGPSGCGKSTLLKAIAGFVTPSGGRILINGAPVRSPSPDRVVVFQEFDQLLPWKTVRGNIVFAQTAAKRLSRVEAERRADVVIGKVGLTDFAHTFPHALSGGMKQRVAIARALAVEPQVLLMDEPFAALDALTRTRMQDELLQLWSDTRTTIVFVTHAIDEAIRIGTRILLLSAHPGRVRAELSSDGSDRIAGSGELLSARIHRLLFDDVRLKPDATGEARLKPDATGDATHGA